MCKGRNPVRRDPRSIFTGRARVTRVEKQEEGKGSPNDFAAISRANWHHTLRSQTSS